jgi:penicillin-binding protein 1A
MGTGAKAMSLGRTDLAGKTGTTSEHVDAWFAGYQSNLVAVSWIGFDNPASLGAGETGAQAALPIWMDYMGRVLQGIPETTPKPPEGVVSVMVDPNTGRRDPSAQGHYADWFYAENLGSSEGAPPETNEKSQVNVPVAPAALPGISFPMESKKPDH